MELTQTSKEEKDAQIEPKISQHEEVLLFFGWMLGAHVAFFRVSKMKKNTHDLFSHYYIQSAEKTI